MLGELLQGYIVGIKLITKYGIIDFYKWPLASKSVLSITIPFRACHLNSVFVLLGIARPFAGKATITRHQHNTSLSVQITVESEASTY
jgi:hypothetical protein